MISFRAILCQCAISLSLLAAHGQAESPRVLNHQGRIAVAGANFQGTGRFKFALVNSQGTQSFWSNDGSSNGGGEPTTFVSLDVTRGLYSVLLGDAAITNMTPVPAEVFQNADVRLRVWFNDGVNGFQHIAPDHRLAAAPYAMMAEKALEVDSGAIVGAPSRQVLAWGSNEHGQTSLPPLAGVAAISARGGHTLVLLDGGTVLTRGDGPAVPAGLDSVTAIAAGGNHNLARRSNGSVVAWGDNSLGQSAVPAGITTATAVAAGEDHSLALLANGTVRAWGDNSFGQTDLPAGLADVIAIAAGGYHSLALKRNGTVVVWGRSTAGQLDVPADLADVVAIGAGDFHSLAVRRDGTVVAWGWNNGQQLAVPPGLSGVIAVAGGYSFSAALKSDGTFVAWGTRGPGLLDVPVDASRLTAIAAGEDHLVALRADSLPVRVARLDESNVGKIGIGRAPVLNPLEVEGNASKTSAGGWLANSDRRIKTDIRTVTGALETLDLVRLVDFRYTDDYLALHPSLGDGRFLNVIAQEFAAVFPDHVRGGGEKLSDGSEILQVDTYPLTIYSAAAIQELHRENEVLKKRVADQEARLRKLEAAIGEGDR
ncbi:tail fiber domain-containing protein [Luteolibacter yonseiensis]|uniref:Tail fiber domain-containing protein n=1 Tax=Luteolibacter yonseiensis TaxID=1144680 RepID=A0A934QZW3_9BACT|nr:tail fiber domain-containing protein [Luteolibacter yonseiensis]MBK1814301.1 tail fiber domain-containing protein [Luteolibacter yonseiensis]